MDDTSDDARLTGEDRNHGDAAAAGKAPAATERPRDEAAEAGSPEETAAYDWASQASGDMSSIESVEYPNFAPPARRAAAGCEPFAQGVSPPAPFVQGATRSFRSVARSARAAVVKTRGLPQRRASHARVRGRLEAAAMDVGEPQYVPRPGEADYPVAAVLTSIQGKYREVDRCN